MPQVFCRESQPALWDERLSAVGFASGLLQSAYWARVIQQVDNAKPFFLEARSDAGDLLASLLLFEKFPWDRYKRRKNYRALLSDRWNGWLEWGDGPVIHTADDSQALSALKALLGWVDGYAQKRGVVSSGFPHASRLAQNVLARDTFLRAGYEARAWATYLVDLSPDEEALWQQVDHAARKSVNKAKRAGARVRRLNNFDEFRESFFPLLEETHATNPLSVSEVSWREDQSAYYRYYVTEAEDGKALATLGIYMFNGIATEIASALSPIAFEQKIPAQDLLHWEIILDAKKNGCHTFDLAGVNPQPASPKEEGIRRFKEKWGGRYVEYDTFEKRSTRFYLPSFVKLLLLNLKKPKVLDGA